MKINFHRENVQILGQLCCLAIEAEIVPPELTGYGRSRVEVALADVEGSAATMADPATRTALEHAAEDWTASHEAELVAEVRERAGWEAWA